MTVSSSFSRLDSSGLRGVTISVSSSSIVRASAMMVFVTVSSEMAKTRPEEDESHSGLDMEDLDTISLRRLSAKASAGARLHRGTNFVRVEEKYSGKVR